MYTEDVIMILNLDTLPALNMKRPLVYLVNWILSRIKDWSGSIFLDDDLIKFVNILSNQGRRVIITG